MAVRRKGRIVKLGASAEQKAARAAAKAARQPIKGRRPAIPVREKQLTWNWFMPDGTIKQGKVPVPGENCEKIPDAVIYANPEARYCTNPNCPSQQNEVSVMGQETVPVAATPALLYQETVAGKDGTYSIAYFCPVCRTYQ